jgi:hypothetical protein
VTRLPTKTTAFPDDWLVDVRFRGLKTGKVIYKRIGVSGFHDEAGAILHAWRSLYINDPDRVVDTVARRRVDVQTKSVARALTKRMREHAQKFTRRTA